MKTVLAILTSVGVILTAYSQVQSARAGAINTLEPIVIYYAGALAECQKEK